MYYTVQSEMVNGSSGREGTYPEAQTAREEFCLVSHRRDKDVPGAFYLSMERPCRPLSHIIIKYPTGGSELHLHQLGQVFGEPAAIKYNECTGTIETEKYFGRLHGT